MSPQKETSLSVIFKKGIILENPIFRLVLGMCSALAVSTSMVAALGMSVSVIVVLVCSNVTIALVSGLIPAQVRIPAYIIIIATFVTIVQMVLKAFAPDIDALLGIYLPLIVVNCVILGRAEAFASKNKVLPSLLDALGIGSGYTVALCSIAFVRELIGSGTLLGMRVLPESYTPIMLFALPSGGFLVLGILMAVCNKIAQMHGKPKAGMSGCEGCPSVGQCGLKLKAMEEQQADKAAAAGKEA